MAAKSVAISDKVVLTTRDVVSPSGALRAVEYELAVNKDRVVVFDIDFTGSTNLSLRGAEGLSKSTTVQPFSSAVVAVVEVRDPSKHWALETRYTWLEESPSAVLPGASKREVLSEGVTIVTTRSARGGANQPDTFTFEAVVDKNATVKLTLDCSDCVNMELLRAAPGAKVASVLVMPYSRTLVAVLAAKNPTKGYALKTKWSWSESAGPTFEPSASPFARAPTMHRDLYGDSPSAYNNHANTNASFNGSLNGSFNGYGYGDAAPPGAGAATTATTAAALIRTPAAPRASPAPLGARRLPAHAAEEYPSQALVPATTGPRGAPAAATSPGTGLTKRIEEISPHVTLTTETVEGSWERPTEVVYHLRVDKNTQISFQADFTGSVNLAVVSPESSESGESGGFHTRAFVPAFETREVARLRCVDPALGWKLVCKYFWEEEDLDASVGDGAAQSESFLGGGAAQIPAPRGLPPPGPVAPAPASHPNGDGGRAYSPRSGGPGSSAAASAGGARYTSLRQLLASLSMEVYVPFFEQEELTLDLLRIMARDEGEFRNSLQQLGISKMGHRERILMAVKASM